MVLSASMRPGHLAPLQLPMPSQTSQVSMSSFLQSGSATPHPQSQVPFPHAATAHLQLKGGKLPEPEAPPKPAPAVADPATAPVPAIGSVPPTAPKPPPPTRKVPAVPPVGSIGTPPSPPSENPPAVPPLLRPAVPARPLVPAALPPRPALPPLPFAGGESDVPEHAVATTSPANTSASQDLHDTMNT
jgi:hypothetical protein